MIEELGFTAEIGTYYGQTDEYFYSRHRDTYYYNPAYLYEATSFKEVQKPLENFNHIAWFPIDEAIQNLKRGSHKWAIESWKKQHKIGLYSSKISSNHVSISSNHVSFALL
ncbi:NTP pyrophosphohydrolase including oxidative damage repair enzymes [Streptococcus pneumoniae]|nr:NTP pyrophosphohydrolase including oxidative damage repair enzymes [Streptococcus pneumoniae]